MKRLITIDISPATATHCGDGKAGCCPGLNAGKGKCRVYRRPLEFSRQLGEYLRLPECIAAEQGAAQKGGEQ